MDPMQHTPDGVLAVPTSDLVVLMVAIAIGTAIVMWLFVEPVITRLRLRVAELEDRLIGSPKLSPEAQRRLEVDRQAWDQVHQEMGWKP